MTQMRPASLRIFALASIALAALPALPGCSSGGHELRPAAQATRAAGLQNAAIASEHDVVVVAQADTWPGQSRVTKHVTPLRVRISSANPQPIAVKYENLVLVAEDGTRYVAIPPRAMQFAKATASGAAQPEQEPSRSSISYSGFQIAPYLAQAYPGIQRYKGSFNYDTTYYAKYAKAYPVKWMPTSEMLSWALPEGVIDSGGYVEGYVYFQPVDRHEDVVRLNARFDKAADPSEHIAKVEIPFQIAK